MTSDLNPSLLSDLAAASRILAARGVVDGFGHVSMRHPMKSDHFLMSRSIAPALVLPGDIVEYHLTGEATSSSAPKGFLERYIHSSIYSARPDIGGIVHSHSPSVIPFTVVQVPLTPIFHNAAFLGAGAPNFDIAEKFGPTDMLVCNCQKGDALAEVLGPHNVCLMRGHGSVACGPSLQIAVFRAVYTEVNARIQSAAMALSGGQPLTALSPQEADLADEPNRTAGMRAWDLWRREVLEAAGW